MSFAATVMNWCFDKIPIIIILVVIIGGAYLHFRADLQEFRERQQENKRGFEKFKQEKEEQRRLKIEQREREKLLK